MNPPSFLSRRRFLGASAMGLGLAHGSGRAAIPTAVSGMRFTEHLPKLARVADRLALVRGLHHPMRNHNSAAAEALTGRTPAGGDQDLPTDNPRRLPKPEIEAGRASGFNGT